MTREDITDWLANALLASGPVHQTLRCFYMVGRLGGLANELVLELNDGRQYRLTMTGPLPEEERVTYVGEELAEGQVVQESCATEPEGIILPDGIDSTPEPY